MKLPQMRDQSILISQASQMLVIDPWLKINCVMYYVSLANTQYE